MRTMFAIWYMRPEFFSDGVMGLDWLRSRGKLPDPAALEKTHVLLRGLELDGGPDQLERVFHAMQGEVWSPNGEARVLIEAKGLEHTSMAVGDIVECQGRVFICDTFGFFNLAEESSQ